MYIFHQVHLRLHHVLDGRGDGAFAAFVTVLARSAFPRATALSLVRSMMMMLTSTSLGVMPFRPCRWLYRVRYGSPQRTPHPVRYPLEIVQHIGQPDVPVRIAPLAVEIDLADDAGKCPDALR